MKKINKVEEKKRKRKPHRNDTNVMF